jgi:hypothetical protein
VNFGNFRETALLGRPGSGREAVLDFVEVYYRDDVQNENP